MLGSLLSACFCRICQLPTLVSWGEQLSQKYQLGAESLQPGASQSASASPLSLHTLLECYLPSSKTKRKKKGTYKEGKFSRCCLLKETLLKEKLNLDSFLDYNPCVPHPWVPSRRLCTQTSVCPRPPEGEEACTPSLRMTRLYFFQHLYTAAFGALVSIVMSLMLDKNPFLRRLNCGSRVLSW